MDCGFSPKLKCVQKFEPFLHISGLARWYFQSVENFGEVMFFQHVCITSSVLFCKMPNEEKN